MATRWSNQIRASKKVELTVFNKAQSWQRAVTKGMDSFNKLAFGVRMVPTNDEVAAHIVVVLAEEPTQYSHDGNSVQTKPDFKPDELDGQTSTMKNSIDNELFFACIFLPGKVKNPTNDQKEMVVVHELIHASGMNEHDSVGIMFSHMEAAGTGLREYLHDKGAKTMPPIRLGGFTKCKMQYLWSSGADECKK